jgi:ABC-type antimicrobial peptide transport system ATPase subunit
MSLRKSYTMILISFLCLSLCDIAYSDQTLSPNAAKQLVRDAVTYVLENQNANMDYSKYVSKDFINPIDGNTFDYDQWVAHQKNIKSMLKSMKPTFNFMVAEGNNVFAIYHIKLIKNDGSELEVKDMALFKIKDNKIIYCEELTRLVKGNEVDKNIGSTK